MRTLFLNPPSFEGFDGGAGSRWPASREIESYWYPVWLCYPAGMLPDSKVVDGPPHRVSIESCVAMASDFELLVLFTSTPGFDVDVMVVGKIAAFYRVWLGHETLGAVLRGGEVRLEGDAVLELDLAELDGREEVREHHVAISWVAAARTSLTQLMRHSGSAPPTPLPRW